MSLTASQIEQFRQDGFLIFRSLAAPEACAAMRDVTEAHLRDEVPPLEYEADVGYAGAPASRDAPGGRTVRRLRGAYHRHPVFRDWAEDPRIAAALAQLFGEPVRLTLAHHNCVMTKHPRFSTATGWHRDIRYWSFLRNDLISVWLALGDEVESNGALKVIPGSHRLDIRREQLDDLDFLRPEHQENQRIFTGGIPVELRQGDVLFFHSGLFHAASENHGNETKQSVVFAYHGRSNEALPGSRSAAAGHVALGPE
ncbi:phytanoyl-CoA hydroxylase [Noviherbaspirillum humi]|uniref:Phytanoyl-CoA hydroxylase n=1 Tax=Noviherbaspirillum humi TaxID=1688639 RepID=A0A239EXI7_9BURK|nr:phytanoyl-CoA dioxygenase family protein [Noviherbaspirillum humi]SNS49329.1 phytanoyl-CoA hydroxylase [Noviherbaspirillum humi]